MIGPGIHTIPAAEYHSDPCSQPSLSASIANIILNASPAHARSAHPRLNPNFVRKEESKYDTGTVAHALLLQGEDVAVVCDYDNWKTHASQDERDAARAAGQVPLLAKDWSKVREMVHAVQEQLADHHARPHLFFAGKPEQAMVWEEDGVTCRALIDWLHDDFSACDDLKSTARSANPEAWSRTMWSTGGPTQAAFYIRGVKALTGLEPEFRFCVVETSQPYALSVISLSPDALALAEAKVERAIKTWRQCMETDRWPAYTTRVAYAEAPPWEESRWLEAEAIREEALA